MSIDAAMSRIGEIQALEATLVQAPAAAAPQPAAQAFSQVLASAGTVDYYCTLHPHMTGRIVVK